MVRLKVGIQSTYIYGWLVSPADFVQTICNKYLIQFYCQLYSRLSTLINLLQNTIPFSYYKWKYEVIMCSTEHTCFSSMSLFSERIVNVWNHCDHWLMYSIATNTGSEVTTACNMYCLSLLIFTATGMDLSFTLSFLCQHV